MEDNNLKLYYSGLEDVMNKGCVRPEHIIPEGWGKSVFIGSLVDLSFYFILFRFIRVCNSNILERVTEVVEGMNNHRDFYSRRLTSNELYKALSILRSDTASFILGKLECTEGVFSEISDALNMKDQSRFVKAIKDCNTAQIKPILNCILYLQNMTKVFELKKSRAFAPKERSIAMKTNGEIVTDGIESGFSITSNGDSVVATDILGIDYLLVSNNLLLRDENQIQLCSQLLRVNDYYNPCYPKKGEGVDLKKCDKELLCSCKYFAFLFQYCRIKDSYVSYFGNKNAFEYLFKLPAVRGMYDEGLKYWKQNCWEKKLAEYESYLLDPENCEDTTASISEPISQDPVVGSAFTWRLPPDFFDNSYIVDCKINEYLQGFLDNKNGFALESVRDVKMPEVKSTLNPAFEDLINYFASEGYIDNDDVTKSSFAYALTGRKVDIKTKKVTWKRVFYDSEKPMNWLNNMCYLVRELHSYYFKDEQGKRMKNKFMHILEVFEIDPPGDYKLSSSYAKNADDGFIKKVEDFLEVVRMVKDSVFPEKGPGTIR